MSEEPAAAQPASFEQALEQLEESAARLEQGDLSLEDALQIFEQGVTASRACARHLDQARKRVQVLRDDGEGGFNLEFLDGEEDAPEPEDA
jgi:exodeoxyribonuclease VII small subunit